MLKLVTAVALSVLAFSAVVMPKPALARDGGAVAAGVIGGLAVGAIVGSQMNRNDGYYGEQRYRECRVERRDFEDQYGRLHVRRVRVCD